MSEKTIRELTGGTLPPDSRIWGYTLEELKSLIVLTEEVELNAVRAFAKKVKARADELDDNSQELYSEHFLQAFEEELAALEKESVR